MWRGEDVDVLEVIRGEATSLGVISVARGLGVLVAFAVAVGIPAIFGWKQPRDVETALGVNDDDGVAVGRGYEEGDQVVEEGEVAARHG